MKARLEAPTVTSVFSIKSAGKYVMMSKLALKPTPTLTPPPTGVIPVEELDS